WCKRRKRYAPPTPRLELTSAPRGPSRRDGTSASKLKCVRKGLGHEALEGFTEPDLLFGERAFELGPQRLHRGPPKDPAFELAPQLHTEPALQAFGALGREAPGAQRLGETPLQSRPHFGDTRTFQGADGLHEYGSLTRTAP